MDIYNKKRTRRRRQSFLHTHNIDIEISPQHIDLDLFIIPDFGTKQNERSSLSRPIKQIDFIQGTPKRINAIIPTKIYQTSVTRGMDIWMSKEIQFGFNWFQFFGIGNLAAFRSFKVWFGFDSSFFLGLVRI
ncbi:hypothetical protein YC2023_016267 [Brassica napus]